MSRYKILHSNSKMRKEKIVLYCSNIEDFHYLTALLNEEGLLNVVQGGGATTLSASLIVLVYPDFSSCLDLFEELKHTNPTIPIIVILSSGGTADIVEVIRMGAYDFFTKPVDERRFLLATVRAIEKSILVAALNFNLSDFQLTYPEAFTGIITCSPEMLRHFKYLERVVNTPHPILITGETGVGKELFAKAVSYLKQTDAFVSLNVAGIDDNVFSDTLFGHTKGAFTGADSYREGIITKAKGGVLFLDEIGDLSELSQIKLLRLIQEGEYYQLGSDTPSHFDSKLVAATNIDLDKAVRDGIFRKDLYYRLTTHHIHIPPLRQRIDDLPLLITHFIGLASRQLNKKNPTIPPELINLLNTYDFPGNVRELESMVNDAVARHRRGILSMATFKDRISGNRKYRKNKYDDLDNSFMLKFPTFPTLKDAEYLLITEALNISGNNQSAAANLLGISRQALNKRINNYKRQQ